MFCTRCGQQNPSDALFCARCGAELVRPGEPVAASAHAPHDGGGPGTPGADPAGAGATGGPAATVVPRGEERSDDERPAERTSLIHLPGISETGETHPVEGEEEDEAFSAVDALPTGSALLVVKRGPNAGSRFLLDQEVTTAGRHPESDIFLDDVTVSRRHAEFRQLGDGSFTVGDVGSLNGTYLNRERIDSAELSGGDEVQIGKFRLLFLLAGRDVPPAALPTADGELG